MHLSTFVARQIEAGNWVIDATSSAGVVQQLAGVFSHKAGAIKWMVDHPAASFMLSKIVAAEPRPILIEPQDILSLERTIESLQRENAWLKARLARDAK